MLQDISTDFIYKIIREKSISGKFVSYAGLGKALHPHIFPQNSTIFIY